MILSFSTPNTSLLLGIKTITPVMGLTFASYSSWVRYDFLDPEQSISFLSQTCKHRDDEYLSPNTSIPLSRNCILGLATKPDKPCDAWPVITKQSPNARTQLTDVDYPTDKASEYQQLFS